MTVTAPTMFMYSYEDVKSLTAGLYDPTTRQELLAETKEFAAPYVQEGVDMLDAKILQPTKEIAAPYIASLQTKREAIMTDKRVQRAVESIQHVREHPQDVALDLKAKAVDLLKYESLESYRSYVSSAEFQQ